MKEETFPHTRKRGQGLTGGSFGATEESAATGRGAERKVERIPHRGSVPTRTPQPETLVCPLGWCRSWMQRLGLQRSDPRERTGIGCVKTARGG